MTGGPIRREQSDRFSLKELMKLEDERVQEQKRDRSLREQAAVRERAEVERRRREDAEAGERLAAETRERERRAELDGIARREAIQKAVVEQTRLEVEVRARAEERELERKHELELSRLRVEAAKKGQLGSLAGATLLGGGVMLFVAIGVHLGVVKPAVDRRVAELQVNVVAESTRADELVRELTERLEKTLGSQAQAIEQLKSKIPKQPSAPATTRKTDPPPPPPPPVRCLPGDPLCPTIPR